MTNRSIFPAVILLGLLYIFFLNERQPVLVSDSLDYFEQAIIISKGGVLSDKYIFFKPPAWPMTIGLLFSVFENSKWTVFYFQLMTYLLVIAIVLYNLPENLSKKLSWIIFFILAINVAFVPLMGTLLSEIWFGLWFLIGHISLYKLLSKKGKNYSLWCFCIASFTMAQLIRPIAFYYILFAWTTAILLYTIQTKKVLNTVLLKGAIAFIVFTISTTLSYRSVGYGNRWQPVQDGTWGIYYGLNPDGFTQQTIETDIKWISQIAAKEGWGEVAKDSLKSGIKARIPIITPNIHTRFISNFSRMINPFHIAFSGVLSKAISHESKYKILYKVIFLLSTISILLIYLYNIYKTFTTMSELKKYGKITNQQIYTTSVIGGFLLYLILHTLILEIQARYLCHFILINP
jgi:hypothetical protein